VGESGREQLDVFRLAPWASRRQRPGSGHVNAATIRSVAYAKRVLRPDVHFEAHFSEILNACGFHGCVVCASCI
jgi:hypothetical protein